MIILRQKVFATTGEALEKKANKLMKEHKLTKSQALDIIKKRDKIAVDLNKQRNIINSPEFEKKSLKKLGLENINGDLRKSILKHNKNIARIDSQIDANMKSLGAIADSKNARYQMKKKAIDRHAERDLSGKGTKIKLNYALRNAKNWAKNNKGAIALGVGTGIAGGIGANIVMNKKKKEENEKKNK